MTWRIVKQPNGLYARFSEAINDFTDFDCNYDEIMEVCLDHTGPESAKESIEWADQHPNRYDESIQIYRKTYGHERARAVHALMSSAAEQSDDKQEPVITNKRQDLIDAVNLITRYVSQNLPDDWQIELHMTKGESYTKLYDPAFNELEDLYFGDDSVIVEMCQHAREAEAALQETEENKKQYLIECREHTGDLRLWWKPDRKGYTTLISDAGLYSLKEAKEICGVRKDEVMWLEKDAVAAARNVVPK